MRKSRALPGARGGTWWRRRPGTLGAAVRISPGTWDSSTRKWPCTKYSGCAGGRRLRRAPGAAPRCTRWDRGFAARGRWRLRHPGSRLGGSRRGSIQFRRSGRCDTACRASSAVTDDLCLRRRRGQRRELLLAERCSDPASDRIPWFDPEMRIVPPEGPERRSKRTQAVAERSHRTQTIPRRSTQWQRKFRNSGPRIREETRGLQCSTLRRARNRPNGQHRGPRGSVSRG